MATKQSVWKLLSGASFKKSAIYADFFYVGQDMLLCKRYVDIVLHVRYPKRCLRLFK